MGRWPEKQHFSPVVVSSWSRDPGEPGREGAPAPGHDPPAVHAAGPAPDGALRAEEHGRHAVREAAAADGAGPAAAGAGRSWVVSGWLAGGGGGYQGLEGSTLGATLASAARGWGQESPRSPRAALWTSPVGARGAEGAGRALCEGSWLLPAPPPAVASEGGVSSWRGGRPVKGAACRLPCPGHGTCGVAGRRAGADGPLLFPAVRSPSSSSS